MKLLASPGLRPGAIATVCLLFFSFLTQKTYATHFRYGTITWEAAGTASQPRLIRFKVRAAFRRSFPFPGSSGFPVVGSTVSTGFGLTIRNAANTSTLANPPINLLVTSINTAEDYLEGEFQYTFNYPANGNYLVFFEECCRISAPPSGQLRNNGDGNFRVETTVTVGNTNNSPIATVPAIINVPTNVAAATYPIAATDPDGDALTFVLATPPSFGVGCVNAPGLSVSGSNFVFNTVGKPIGSLWNGVINITDSRGARIALDVLFKITGASTPPQFIYPPTPANSSQFNIQPNTPVSFNISASDLDAGDIVTLNASGVPIGASFASGTNGNPATTSFSWTPTASQVGTYLINFTATDVAGVTTPTSVIIRVSVDPEFIAPTPGDMSIFCAPPGVPISVTFTARDVDPQNRVSISAQLGVVPGMSFSPALPTAFGNPATTDFSWTPLASDWGAKTLVLKATNLSGFFKTNTITWIVNNPPVVTSMPATNTVTVGQFYSYTITADDADIPQGDHVEIETSTLPSFLSIVDNGNNTFTVSGTPTLADAGTYNLNVELEDELNHYNGTHCGNVNYSFTLTVDPCTISVSLNATPPACSGASNGSITSTVTGANGSVGYAWSNGATTANITNIPEGYYSLMVTDSFGCTASANTTLNAPADVTPPVLQNVPANATYECDAVAGPAAVTATDNCSGTITPKYYTTPTIKTKLVHYWPGDGNFNDVIGGANGSPVGAVSFSNGIIGNNSFAFDGTTGYISTGTAGSVSGQGNFAVSAWVKTTSNSPMVVIQQRDGSTVNGEYILKIGGNHNNSNLQPGKVYFLAYSTGPVIDVFSANTVNDGKWHQIVAEKDGSTVRIYIDGNLDATGSTTVTVALNSSLVTTIGRDVRDNNANFNGQIDEIKVWSVPACVSTYEFDRVWTATDASGNKAAAVQHITVQDTKAPVISCPANIVMSNSTGQCGANVSYAATATDNCNNATVTYSIAPGSFFAVGTTPVTVTAKDDCGNTSSCSFTVTVNDTEKPNAVCKPVTVTLVNGTATITVNDVNNGSTDNCGISSVQLSKTTFNCSNIGSNNVTLTVTDVHNNIATCTAVVTVNGELPTCSIASVPANNTYTGGVPTNLYIGYGPQSTTLQVSTPASGAPYTYAWSGGTLSNYNTANPVFTATTPGSYTFTVVVTNKYGCKTSCSITICVTDVRVPGTDGKKVYVCHAPNGNPGNANTLSISINAVPSHLGAHPGDRLGTCDQTPCAPSFAGARTGITDKLLLAGGDDVTSLKVTVAPNPTTSQFNVRIQSNEITPVSVRIFNEVGQVVEGLSNAGSNNTISIGSKLKSGNYTLEVIQGGERRMLKLIKLQ